MNNTRDIIKPNTITEMINTFNIVCGEIQQAVNLVDSAKSRLRNVFGDSHCTIFNQSVSDYTMDYKIIQKHLNSQAWRSIVDRTEIRKMITVKRERDLSRNLYNNDGMPELTIENVMSFLNDLTHNLGDFMDESVREVFDLFRPRRNNYKTNSQFMVGKKVIMDRWIECSEYYLGVNHYYEQEIRSIDNVFHLLDGKGIVKYPNDLLTVIKEATSKKIFECETDYFKCKWYKKGSFHITFKRMDLVQKINEIAGGRQLNR